MNRHQVTGWGHDWTLLPHEEPFARSSRYGGGPRGMDPTGWFAEGLTTGPTEPYGEQEVCFATSEAKQERCPKASIVMLVVEVPNGHGQDTDGQNIELCGGHFAVHRRGKPLRLAVALQSWVPA